MAQGPEPGEVYALPDFVFFDYDQPPVLYFLDLLAMMGLRIALSYYSGRALRSRAGRTSGTSSKRPLLCLIM